MDRPSILYVVFVAAAVLVALGERVYARRNETRLLRQGAAEVAPWVFRLMAPVYMLLFPAAIAEHLALGRRAPPVLAASMLVGVFLALAGAFESASIPLLMRLVYWAGLMGLGVWLHLTERHAHEHEHETLHHDHRHVHDEHHQHKHGPSDPPGEPHNHPHDHRPLLHSHPHYPDIHHRHGH